MKHVPHCFTTVIKLKDLTFYFISKCKPFDLKLYAITARMFLLQLNWVVNQIESYVYGLI